MGIQAIARRRPDRLIVQSESAECVHAAMTVQPPEVRWPTSCASCRRPAANRPDADIMLFRSDNGLTREQAGSWRAAAGPGARPRWLRLQREDPETRMAPHISGETYGCRSWCANIMGATASPSFTPRPTVFDPDAAPEWLWETVGQRAGDSGVGIPVLGFTTLWYSLIDHRLTCSWPSGNGTVNACGHDPTASRGRIAGEYRQRSRISGASAPSRMPRCRK
jgi:hypothetical protein